MNRNDDVLGRVLTEGRIRNEAEADIVRRAIADWEWEQAAARSQQAHAERQRAIAAGEVDFTCRCGGPDYRRCRRSLIRNGGHLKADPLDGGWDDATLCDQCGLPLTTLRAEPGLCECEPGDDDPILGGGPAAYRRNLPSMAPGAGPSGGPADTTATGPRPDGDMTRAAERGRLVAEATALPEGAWHNSPDWRLLPEDEGGR